MKLHDDWKNIVRHAWSMRLMLLVTLLGCAEALLPYFSDAIPRGIFAALTVIFAIASMVARLIAQPATLAS